MDLAQRKFLQGSSSNSHVARQTRRSRAAVTSNTAYLTYTYVKRADKKLTFLQLGTLHDRQLDLGQPSCQIRLF
jgi:hypothetical protein